MMYKSQFQNIDPYDWFCGPGSNITYFSNTELVSLYIWKYIAALIFTKGSLARESFYLRVFGIESFKNPKRFYAMSVKL